MGVSEATVPCPACAQPVDRVATGCEACAVRLAPGAGGALVAVLPPIMPGPIIAGYDLTRQMLPDCKSRDEAWTKTTGCAGSPDGAILRLHGGIIWSQQRHLRIRDVCVRACFDALDPGLRVRVVVRKDAVGVASVWYEMGVTSDDRGARLARVVSAAGRIDSTPLLGPVVHAAVAAAGASNIVELRAQGPTLEGWVNGVRIGAVHDPTFGIGSVAIAVGSVDASPPPQRALVRWFEIYEVKA